MILVPICWLGRATVQPRLFERPLRLFYFRGAPSSSWLKYNGRALLFGGPPPLKLIPRFNNKISSGVNNNGLVFIFGGPPLLLDLFSDFTTAWRFFILLLPSLILLTTRLIELTITTTTT